MFFILVAFRDQRIIFYKKAFDHIVIICNYVCTSFSLYNG